MIIHSFDPASPAVLRPADLCGPGARLADACLITFSQVAFSHALQRFPSRRIALVDTLNGGRPVHLVEYKGREIALYLSPITAAGAGTMLEQAAQLIGARHYVVFGSCGALDAGLTEGRLIVPTEAYRDEGLSYHYAPAADYIEVKNAARVASVLARLQIPHVRGRAWTTDALFRETRDNLARRRAEGCIAVDMECAGLQALCDFRGFEYYTFFYSGDLLDAPAWQQRILSADGERDHQLANLVVGLEIAAEAAGRPADA